MLYKNLASIGWCLDEDGRDQNRDSVTINVTNSFTADNCFDACIRNDKNHSITGCEYHDGGGCAYHTRSLSGANGNQEYTCWILNGGFLFYHILQGILSVTRFFKTIYTYDLLSFIRHTIYTSGSFYDQCIAKNGLHYIRDGGEDGCYYFHSLSFSMEYDYNKSKEFCENISGANGSLPIIKGPKDNNNMLHLLNGYV